MNILLQFFKNTNETNGFTDGVLYFNNLGYNYYEIYP
jgi:hypothetical protein